MAERLSNGLSNDCSNSFVEKSRKLFCTHGRDGQTASMEELVASFDKTLENALSDSTRDVIHSNSAPIQTSQELVRDDPVWRSWFINNSNTAPIDWSRSAIRSYFSLNFTANQHLSFSRPTAEDKHHNDVEDYIPIFSPSCVSTTEHGVPEVDAPSSDDVLREIDQIMSEEPKLGDSIRAAACGSSMVSHDDDLETVLAAMENQLKSLPPVYAEKLKFMSCTALSDLSADLEKLTQQLSKILVHALAEREELEYSKEVKNDFISALLAVDLKKKQVVAAVKPASTRSTARKSKSSYNLFGDASTPPAAPEILSSASILSMSTPRQFRQVAEQKARDAISSIVSKNQNKYLRTTLIPYVASEALTVQHLHALMGIFEATMTDNPATPRLLTDYILNLVCPRV